MLWVKSCGANRPVANRNCICGGELFFAGHRHGVNEWQGDFWECKECGLRYYKDLS